jgi:hypothetical protein
MQIEFAATGLELGQEADQILEASAQSINAPKKWARPRLAISASQIMQKF